MLTSKQIRGFTIVELLIVIVIVGILAAITIVAFNGIQSRAYNTKVESTVASYKKILSLYTAQYGKYPLSASSGCLGAVADYNSNNCYAASPSATMEAELKKVATTLPAPDLYCFQMYGPNCRRNMTLYYNNTGWQVDGKQHSWYLIYFLKNNGDCTLPNNLEGTYGNFSSTVSRKYTERDSGTTMCVTALPDDV